MRICAVDMRVEAVPDMAALTAGLLLSGNNQFCNLKPEDLGATWLPVHSDPPSHLQTGMASYKESCRLRAA